MGSVFSETAVYLSSNVLSKCRIMGTTKPRDILLLYYFSCQKGHTAVTSCDTNQEHLHKNSPNFHMLYAVVHYLQPSWGLLIAATPLSFGTKNCI